MVSLALSGIGAPWRWPSVSICANDLLTLPIDKMGGCRSSRLFIDPWRRAGAMGSD